MNNEIKALYEIRRQVFLNGYLQNPNNYDDSLAYAYYNRIAPVLNMEGSRNEAYVFDEACFVKSDFAKQVLDYLDDKWLKKEWSDVTFYKLEDLFGGYHSNRVELIYILAYARIQNLFDNALWDAVESDAPTEAKPITSKFSPQEVTFS